MNEQLPNLVRLELEDMPDSHTATAKYIEALRAENEALQAKADHLACVTQLIYAVARDCFEGLQSRQEYESAMRRLVSCIDIPVEEAIARVKAQNGS